MKTMTYSGVVLYQVVGVPVLQSVAQSYTRHIYDIHTSVYEKMEFCLPARMAVLQVELQVASVLGGQYEHTSTGAGTGTSGKN